ncbi:hypothetical protein VIOR3934_09083 [Vibrio orientalis CIP 102891 = ATCC 33934]|uniref:Uncharacterized protein n=1 Tax=Vibrio orientalis CIP 102891 = ATCC 33934 TaxID=675816 RepID=C9QJM6_VIBOR|nr:hypothetical protein VIA_002510 [Vibrio orientalis CIP 102891 = ATCC 33934]EGU47943.1 hypothetical protein VIOR3934_09083 [Vibrio orientalis CIP 102891 = ATCC 33934]
MLNNVDNNELGMVKTNSPDLHDWLITTPATLVPFEGNELSPQTKKTHLSESFESSLYV